MSRRAPSAQARRKSGRSRTLLWIAAMAAIIIGLLYTERVALLYVLATLGVTVLLVVVALADLGAAKKGLTESAPAPADDAAAIGSGITSTIPAGATTATTSSRAAKRR